MHHVIDLSLVLLHEGALSSLFDWRQAEDCRLVVGGGWGSLHPGRVVIIIKHTFGL